MCRNFLTQGWIEDTTAAYDATQDVGYDATQDVGYVIDQARQDLTSLQTLTQRIAGGGGAAPSGAASTVTSVSSANTAAISHTNADIDQANATATMAYKIAADLSTGECSGYADSAFQAVRHIG